jgi:hypothetical protein
MPPTRMKATPRPSGDQAGSRSSPPRVSGRASHAAEHVDRVDVLLGASDDAEIEGDPPTLRRPRRRSVLADVIAADHPIHVPLFSSAPGDPRDCDCRLRTARAPPLDERKPAAVPRPGQFIDVAPAQDDACPGARRRGNDDPPVAIPAARRSTRSERRADPTERRGVSARRSHRRPNAAERLDDAEARTRLRPRDVQEAPARSGKRGPSRRRRGDDGEAGKRRQDDDEEASLE